MALVAPEDGWVWISVPAAECLDVLVVGEIHTWWSHWYRAPGEKRAAAMRCVLDERGKCDLCRAGYERRARYVFPVEHDAQVRLVELGRVQFPALAMLEQFGEVVGARLRLVRERPVQNAPIQVRKVGAEIVPPERRHDVEGFVATLGVVQLRLFGEEATHDGKGASLRIVEGKRRSG